MGYLTPFVGISLWHHIGNTAVHVVTNRTVSVLEEISKKKPQN